MRVPPAQSSTVAEQLASASSGSRARKPRVTLVSRVPNRNTDTRLRASVMACRKCRNSLVYSLIEPEISSSATIGVGLSIRPSRWMSMMSPPVRNDAAQRAAHVEPQAPRVGLIAAGAQFGLRQFHLRDGAGGCCDFGRAHLREVLLLQHLLVRDRKPELLLLGLRRFAHMRVATTPPGRGARPVAAFSWRDPAAAPNPACASTPRRRGRTGRRPARISAHARGA